MKIKLRPFLTPNFAIAETEPGKRQDGMTSPPSFPLSALDTDELSAMCDQFRAEVFRKAGKQDPARMEASP